MIDPEDLLKKITFVSALRYQNRILKQENTCLEDSLRDKELKKMGV